MNRFKVVITVYRRCRAGVMVGRQGRVGIVLGAKGKDSVISFVCPSNFFLESNPGSLIAVVCC